MTMELLSTSVPAGLEPGSSGYCTVAMSRGIPRPLVQQLETLSAYRPLFLPGDPRAAHNPVAVSHLRFAAGGKNYALLSRVCYSGADYSGRSNRFAHHVVMEQTDSRPPGGPAWVMSRPAFFQTTWDHKVCWLPGGKPIPQGPDGPAFCPTWQRVTGDPGWAGVLAAAMAQEGGKPFYLLYDAGADVLPLIAEALNVLPAGRRWNVTFTTYYAGMPPGVSCQIRGVVRGSPEAQGLAPGSFLDLAELRGRKPATSEWVETARSGQRRVTAPAGPVLAPVAGVTGMPATAVTGWAAPGTAGGVQTPMLGPVNGLAFQEGDAPPLPPESFPAAVPADREPPRAARTSGSAKWLMVSASLVFMLVLGGGGYLGVLLVKSRNGDSAHVTPVENGNEKDGGASSNGKGTSEPARVNSLGVKVGKVPVGEEVVVQVEPVVEGQGEKPFPLGKVRYKLDGVPVVPAGAGEGKTVRLPPFPKAGKHAIEVTFAGDEHFSEAAPEKAEFEVVRRQVTGFRLTRKDDKPVPAGQEVAVTIVAAEADRKDVEGCEIQIAGEQSEDWKPASGGKAKTGLERTVRAPVAAGNYRLRAVVRESERVAGTASKPEALVVSRVTPKLTAGKIDPKRFSLGLLDLDVQVQGLAEHPPRGTIRVTVEDSEAKKTRHKDEKPAPRAKVSLTRDKLSAGRYTVKAAYEPAKDERTYAGVPEVVLAKDLVVVPQKTYEEVRLNERDQASTAMVAFQSYEPRKEVQLAVPGGKPGGAYALEFLPSERETNGRFFTEFNAGEATVAVYVYWQAPPIEIPDLQPAEVMGAVVPWSGWWRVPRRKHVFTFYLFEPRAPEEKVEVKHRLGETPEEGRPPGAVRGFVRGEARLFRQDLRALHEGLIEIYAAAREKGKPSVRIRQGDLPLLRLQLVVKQPK